ncbi:hypothetical protein ACO22_06188 [Paracoccidioides brasiliensis]|uniref:Uncharacterized protein n=1 Tax=Paracoccidioides brasiliensis TaxID=121759 RepID=A0A1D2J897_PARBR|nr:hypothetical protein ACO22_06188 [Paracoccidioides brasiliensis]
MFKIFINDALILQYSADKVLDNSKRVDMDVHIIIQGLEVEEHIMWTTCQMLSSVNLHWLQELTITQSRSVDQ